MKIILTFYFAFISFLTISAQNRVEFSTLKKTVKIPFKLINNLIIVPVHVNGTELNFLLDSGVEETILFSLDEKEELPLFNVEKILLKGLGTQEPIEGLKSYKNTFSVSGLDFFEQEIVVVLDQNFNFSSSLGTEVNGIMGFNFFNQNILKIDYVKKMLLVYNPKKFDADRTFSKFKVFNFALENAKPYLTVQIELNDHTFDAKCLIDTGNSDGLWLFESKSKDISIPEKNFDDFLGRGFSGEIFGKKAKISSVVLDEFKFNNVITAFPDSVSLASVKMVESRMGSIGGEILRRFTAIYDYQNKKVYLKKNKFYKDKFRYNNSGITIHHSGVQWYKEELQIDNFVTVSDESAYKKNSTDLKYNFKLIPIYEILNIRKNSPAAKVGLLSGDIIVKINGNSVYKLNLEQVNQLLKMENERDVSLVIERKGKEFNYKFKIVDLL